MLLIPRGFHIDDLGFGIITVTWKQAHLFIAEANESEDSRLGARE